MRNSTDEPIESDDAVAARARVIMGEIGSAQLMTHDRALGALDQIKQASSSTDIAMAWVLDAVRQSLIDMNAGDPERLQNSDARLAQQSFQKAMVMLKLGKIDKAITFFDEAENRWPDFRTYLQRGICYLHQDYARDAEIDFSCAIKLASGENQARMRSLIRLILSRMYFAEATLHLKNGKHAEYTERFSAALEECQHAVKEDPEFSEAQFGLAFYLAANKTYDSALKILLRIIPENPHFIARLQNIDVFAPLRVYLKNTLGKNRNTEVRENMTASQANLNIIKDCIDLGDLETAKEHLHYLFENDPEYLRKLEIWKIPEFTIFGDYIEQMTEKFLRLAGQHNSEWGYAIIGIALHADKINRSLIYMAFKIAVEKDPDFRRNNFEKIMGKCVTFMDDRRSVLFGLLLTKYPRDLPESLLKLVAEQAF